MKKIYKTLIIISSIISSYGIGVPEKEKQELASTLLKEQNVFQFFKIKPESTKKEIKTAFKKFQLKWHPDRNDGFFVELIKKANDFYPRLLNALEKKLLKADYYTLFGIKKNASNEEIESAYQDFIESWTKETNPKLFSRAQRAKRNLLDETRRNRYNNFLKKQKKLLKVNYYTLFGIKKNASNEEIKSAYQDFIKTWTKKANPELFFRAQRAKRNLLNKAVRKEYNEFLRKSDKTKSDKTKFENEEDEWIKIESFDNPTIEKSETDINKEQAEKNSKWLFGLW